jgi:hypothetical protein
MIFPVSSMAERLSSPKTGVLEIKIITDFGPFRNRKFE